MSYDFTEDFFTTLNESLIGYQTNVPTLQFMVDAQLPISISEYLKSRGHDSKHTLELPAQNATSDQELMRIATIEQRILITKDDDFLQSYLLYKMPAKLLLIKTGNIRNKELFDIFQNGLDVMCRLFSKHSLIEVTRETIITHD